MKGSALKDHFLAIVATIPRAKRLQIKSDLVAVAAHFGIENDLTEDRRKSNWSSTGLARQTVEARKPYLLTYRGVGSYQVSLREAAEICRAKEATIRARLSRQGVYTTVGPDEDIITVKRIEE